MLSKLTLLALLVVAGVKLLGKQRLKGLFRRFDRFINLLLIVIAVVYSVQLLWLALGRE
jgi:Mn2+/Fe2+ NRAMP family transporter